jgi:polyferredoxin
VAENRRKPSRHAIEAHPKSSPATSAATSPAKTTATPAQTTRRLHWPLDLRETVRALAIAGLLAAGARYIFFASYVETGVGTAVARPEAADAFLPLGGIAALKVWLSSGQVDIIHPAALVIVVATLVTAWIFRRALCSWLCPLGAVSEYLARLGRRIFGRNLTVPKWLDRTLLGFKYVVTAAILLGLLLVPASDIQSFMQTPFYSVADMKLYEVYAQIGLAGAAVLVVLAFASMLVKSFWCRYLCPYGALQGMLGMVSPVSIVRDDDVCTGCARCSKACPNGVNVAAARGSVKSPECIGCTTCVTTCPREGALGMRLFGRWPVKPAEFGLAFVAVFMAIVIGAVVTGHWTSSLSTQDYHALISTAASVKLP